jgi:hypothetical protein
MTDNVAYGFYIDAYIENPQDWQLGGFHLALPTTKERLQPYLKSIGLGKTNSQTAELVDISSSIPELSSVVASMKTPIRLDELNYLAVKLRLWMRRLAACLRLR